MQGCRLTQDSRTVKKLAKMVERFFLKNSKIVRKCEEVNSVKEQILAVQRMQDYIEEHLNEKIGLSELSNVSLFSPWYSYRLFQQYTGLTPADYIRRLRLAKAALRIKNEHIRMIDAAFDLGFGSVDGFTRAFTREFGMCPSTYAADPFPLRCFSLTVQNFEPSERILQLCDRQASCP